MNIKKIIVSIIIALILINIIFVTETFAIGEILDSGENFLKASEGQDEVIQKGALREANSKVYNILLLIGIAVAVIVGAALGITFILSSAEGKAKVSETLLPYIIGCFVVFGALAIWGIVINIGNNISSNIDTSGTTSTTYTKKNGNLYCDNCGDVLSTREQHNGKCFNCGKNIKGI